MSANDRPIPSAGSTEGRDYWYASLAQHCSTVDRARDLLVDDVLVVSSKIANALGDHPFIGGADGP